MRPSTILATTLAMHLGLGVEAFSPSTNINPNVGRKSSFLKKEVPSYSFVHSANHGQQKSLKMMMDPSIVIDASSGLVDHSMSAISSSPIFDELNTDLLAFADQGQNLAGIFFQASLLPYLCFLYFLGYKGNRTPDVGNFGFQFLLLFVLSTIPGGIISKATYGCSLADVDWLHGAAEALLTVTNLLIVFGFREAQTKTEQTDVSKLRLAAFGTFGAFAAAAALGPSLGVQAHSPFLFGLGGLPADLTASLPWVSYVEPINALSIPTWAIHSSSVIEFIFAMNVIWNYAETTGNEKWKGMTWGMLPLHASGIAACTYHFFYNPSSFQFMVSTQAGLTLLGNITLAIAAFRIARSNGWTIADLNPFPKSSTSPTGLVADNIAALPLKISTESESELVLAGKLSALTLAVAYAVKYGELGLDIPFNPNPAIGVGMVLSVPALTAANFWNKSQEDGEGFTFPSFGGDGEGLSMTDVKKYGVAGTVAYVITELAFWAVAFPVASTALYQSTGHWPDVINDTADRTTVLGFIFAGANIARLAVPLRLGAALALAPWVDENIINRGEKTEDSE